MELGAAWPCHGIVGKPVLWKYTCRDSVWNFVLNTCGYPATSIVSSGQAGGERVWSGRGAGHHFGEMNGRQQQVVVYKLPQRECAERCEDGVEPFCMSGGGEGEVRHDPLGRVEATPRGDRLGDCRRPCQRSSLRPLHRLCRSSRLLSIPAFKRSCIMLSGCYLWLKC